MRWIVFLIYYIYFKAKDVLGEHCKTSEGLNGVCIHIQNCRKALKDIKNYQIPKTCSFEGVEPIVCCAENEIISNITERIISRNVTKNASLAAQKCKKSVLAYYEPAIAGGKPALRDEFPHMVALGFGNDINTVEWQCGGSLISEKFILTAAHCLSSRLGPPKWARLGTLNIRNRNLDPSRNLEIIKTYIHPNYSPPRQYHDIGLVELKNEVTFQGGYISPICLYSDHELPKEIPIATGWGRLSYGGEPSDALLKVSLHYFNNSYCNDVYKNINKRKLPEGIQNETQVCAGGIDEEKDTCQGDSGGPLQINLDKFYLVGVTSFGKGCGIANIPGVYTRVSYYLPWIESIVWADEIHRK